MTDLLLQLDGKGPAFEQIYRALASSIRNGVIRAGTRLPPTRDLARQLRVGRNTVLAAYELLRDERLVVARGSGGTLVSFRQETSSQAAPVPDSNLPASTAFATRLRLARIEAFRRPERTFRYDLIYGEPFVNPPLFTNLAKSLSFAALNSEGRYVGPQGLFELRQQIAAYLGRRRGILCQAEDIVVVGGTQQAVSLISRLLLEEGDHVVMEEPRYERAAVCMSVHGATVHCLPVDENGLTCEGIEELEPKLVFVTPAHQFPSGAQLSIARRRQLLSLAKKNRFWIVEDDYDGEFDLDRDASPALKAIDSDGVVIYVGTFSKTIFPTLRLGYLIAPPALSHDLVKAKMLTDLESSGLDQLALTHFMRSGAFERHLRKVSAELRRRRKVLEEGLQEHCGGAVVVSGASGMHCVAWFPGLQESDLDRLIQRAAERDVGHHSIKPHYQKQPPMPGLLLGFARLSVTQLNIATRIIGECLKETGPKPLRGSA